MAEAGVERGLKHWAWLGRVAAGFGFLLVLTVVVLDVLPARDGSEGMREVLFALVYRLPEFFYLVALWLIARAFGRLGRGMSFDVVIPRLLFRLGLALALGAAFHTLLMPLLMHLLFPELWRPFGFFFPPIVAVGVVGLLLMLLARPYAEAAKSRRELDDFI